jgi:hypothetical protein
MGVGDPCTAQVVRAEEFSPVKNAPGSASDSPDTARAHLMALHSRSAALRCPGGRCLFCTAVRCTVLQAVCG